MAGGVAGGVATEPTCGRFRPIRAVLVSLTLEETFYRQKKESGIKNQLQKFNIASGEKIFPLQTENEARTVEVFEGRRKAISETEAEIKAVSRT